MILRKHGLGTWNPSSPSYNPTKCGQEQKADRNFGRMSDPTLSRMALRGLLLKEFNPPNNPPNHPPGDRHAPWVKFTARQPASVLKPNCPPEQAAQPVPTTRLRSPQFCSNNINLSTHFLTSSILRYNLRNNHPLTY